MFIEKITINNFRVYKGKNEIALAVDPAQNVSIISGNNGFGKTSLLTSLVWCLYGKLMGDVDERYRKEIYESGGYKRYCEKILNRVVWTENRKEIQELQYKFSEASPLEKEELSVQLRDLSSFSVSLRLTKIFIPSIPCEYVEITRQYDVVEKTEEIKILIDGRSNELTKEVGSEIFINDFILPKEIAKFFFFDAEKIVSLAEIKSVDEKRSLSQAYAEVLGIKKYHDLKENLENVRLRLRKKTSSSADREKLDRLRKQIEQNKKLLAHNEEMIKEKEEELNIKKHASDKFQEQLIREGSAITLEELKDFKQMKDHLSEEGRRLKIKLKDLTELAPFAIATGQLVLVKSQLELEEEHNNKEVSEAFLKRKVTAIKRAVKKLSLNQQKSTQLFEIIENVLLPDEKEEFKPLLDFSFEQQNRFNAVYDNLQNSYSRHFRQLTSDLKKQQSAYNIIVKKLQDAESKESDPVIKAIRSDKTNLDIEIKSLENEKIELMAKTINIQNETNNLLGQASELTKRVTVEDIDKAKDETAARLIIELQDFINRLKVKKKSSLEANILRELHLLMHKTHFVTKVNVIIEGDLIDIELYDKKDEIINKDSLSKGEQQLYATALLKALVDESNIRFPVFIDSPLQKFDKDHARNIIVDFYPNVAGQVILFPLLEKELNEQEYKLLFPRIGNVYLIQHTAEYESRFKPVSPDKLFSVYRKINEHVYQH